MTARNTLLAFALALAFMFTGFAARNAAAAPALDLTGYTDSSGAITVLHSGESTDPYFAMQALLLAHDNGMDISAPAERFARWLVPFQKPDGTFDRFCRKAGSAWASCKTADADDSLLAMWMRLIDTLPPALQKSPVMVKSRIISRASLDHLYQPSRGIYMVSPVYLHGLFMDNLEVWALADHGDTDARKLAAAIHATFWDPVNKRYLVSTQLEQRTQKPAFYPDHVAQVFPLLMGYPQPERKGATHYREWMREHRAEWLRQGVADYPWGLIAVLAMRQRDTASAACWLRHTAGMRHSARWAVTDETAWQIVTARGVKPAPAGADCN
jgi:hypothetical protein